MYICGLYVEEIFAQPTIPVFFVTFCLLSLVTLVATQDIAVDGTRTCPCLDLEQFTQTSISRLGVNSVIEATQRMGVHVSGAISIDLTIPHED